MAHYADVLCELARLNKADAALFASQAQKQELLEELLASHLQPPYTFQVKYLDPPWHN